MDIKLLQSWHKHKKHEMNAFRDTLKADEVSLGIWRISIVMLIKTI